MRYVEKDTNIIDRSAQDNLLRTELRPDNIVGSRLAVSLCQEAFPGS